MGKFKVGQRVYIDAEAMLGSDEHPGWNEEMKRMAQATYNGEKVRYEIQKERSCGCCYYLISNVTGEISEYHFKDSWLYRVSVDPVMERLRKEGKLKGGVA